jgi:hypothetical protein
VRRIDLWLIPWLCLLYLLSFLGTFLESLSSPSIRATTA